MKRIHVNFIFILFVSFSLQMAFATDYPKEWWKPFPKEAAEPWEILPQEAKPGEVILSKRTALGILSNFALTPFMLDGKKYASVEGFWQMMKYPDLELINDPRNNPAFIWKFSRDDVSQLSGFEAKEAGNATKENYQKLGIFWISYQGIKMEYKGKDQEVHYQLIFRATQEKINQNKAAKDILLSTGDLILKPDHHQEPDAPPAYRYYDILMKIRSEFIN